MNTTFEHTTSTSTVRSSEQASGHRFLVVIVTYNRLAQLKKSLSAYERAGILNNADICIVNNASNDGTKEYLEQLTDVIALHQDTNKGSAGAFAEGMRYATENGYDWVWLFNDDSRPLKGAFESLVTATQRLHLTKVGGIKVGMMKDGLIETLYWNGKRESRWVKPCNELIETDLLTFDGAMISVDLIRNVGTCDPRFFMGIYEFDLCLRAKKQGYRFFTIPNGLIEDEKMGSANGHPYWRMYYVTRNHLYLGLKTRSARTIMSFASSEAKKMAHILFFQQGKAKKIRYKALGILHALQNKMGRTIMPS